MNLDKRINDNYKIYTCFDVEEAKHYVGKHGYFTNDICDFNALYCCYYGTLKDVYDNNSRPYINKAIGHNFSFFLPEEFVM